MVSLVLTEIIITGNHVQSIIASSFSDLETLISITFPWSLIIITRYIEKDFIANCQGIPVLAHPFLRRICNRIKDKKLQMN